MPTDAEIEIHAGVCTVCSQAGLLTEHIHLHSAADGTVLHDTQWICQGCEDFLEEYESERSDT